VGRREVKKVRVLFRQPKKAGRALKRRKRQKMTNYQEECDIIKRKLLNHQLFWWEKVLLHAEFHAYKIAQFGQGKPACKGGWNLVKSGNELGISSGKLHQDLRLAFLLKIDPKMRNVQKRIHAIAVMKMMKENKSVAKEMEEI
jgi:hypothetical protein